MSVDKDRFLKLYDGKTKEPILMVQLTEAYYARYLANGCKFDGPLELDMMLDLRGCKNLDLK